MSWRTGGILTAKLHGGVSEGREREAPAYSGRK
jgi:hypothetical protein